jgi:hypothetical protein
MFFAEIEQSVREVIHSPPSSAEVKNMPLGRGQGRLYRLNVSDIISKDTNIYA